MKNNRQDLLEEWDYEKNYPLTPKELTRGSDKKVWWKHVLDNGSIHYWSARIGSRTHLKCGCPYCTNQKLLVGFNDFETGCKQHDREDILDLWDYVNNSKKPNEVQFGSMVKCYLKCPICNESRKITLSKMSTYIKNNSKAVCKICCRIQTSYPEQLLFIWLQRYFTDTKNRHVVDEFEFDIYIEGIRLAIEYDGMNWHKGADSDRREETKNNKASELGINLIRVKENDDVKVAYFKENVIYYKPNNNKGYNNITEVTAILAEYINNKYDTNIRGEISSKMKIAARENTIYSKEESSLQFKRPELAKDLHPTKNGNISPLNIASKSDLNLWWQCSKCGYEWQERVSSRVTQGIKCKSCSYQPIDFDTLKEYPIGSIEGNYDIEYIRLFDGIKERIISNSNLVIRLLQEMANMEEYRNALELVVDNSEFNGREIILDGGERILSNRISRNADRIIYKNPYTIFMENGGVVYVNINLGFYGLSFICRILDICELPRDTVKIKYADKQEDGSWDLLAGIL